MPSRNRSRSGSRNRKRRQRSRSPMSSRRRHQGTRENPEPNKCLGVFNLSPATDEAELNKVFKRFRPLEVNLVRDRQFGDSKGFAFIHFESQEDADEARNVLNGMEVDGRKVRVDYSITRRAHTPTPGTYLGRPTNRTPPVSRTSPSRHRRGGRGRSMSRSRSRSSHLGGKGRYRSRSRSRSRSFRRQGRSRSRCRSFSPRRRENSPRKY